jgi:hypothetical protein
MDTGGGHPLYREGKAVEVLGAKGTVADAFDIILSSHEI